MKVVTVVGARPQFIKAAAVSRVLRQRHTEILVHTGQHYDYEMSGIFFEGLEIPAPEVNLEVGSGTHGSQTGKMLAGIEEVLQAERADQVLVYGDTNSTLAGALAASKLHIPVAHVEAGLRSFNRLMPEEINRVVADHVSELLFCPSYVAVKNLSAEGITRGVHVVGDVMLDVLNWARARAEKKADAVLQKFGLEAKRYLLATVHRSENTDDPQKLSAVLDAFNGRDETILFPMHPRTRKMIKAQGLSLKPHVRVVEPLGYFDMVVASAAARAILTDSGGVQKEAYWLGVPCITLREQTEWVETVENGWNILVGTNGEKILTAMQDFAPPSKRPLLYGDGETAERCVALLGN
ncbi:MAG TPA: UDP-N-acetylglucosamine 2-epimerase (non-hydrolyzing) [Candidatus Binatia bacterium]|nr:UDP-N-acetylglucosamine 2-epimerase (non-hydrolyzing) [Candidatus Binatia bacterium]